MSSELYEHRPTVVTIEAVESEVSDESGILAVPGNLRVTDQDGNVIYVTVQDFERNYKPQSRIKELGHMKLPNYPGSVVEIFHSGTAAGLQSQINDYFHEGKNALVLEQHYWADADNLYAAFTLNTVVSEDELNRRTVINKKAEELWEEEQAEKAKVNRTALEIGRKLTTERQAEEAQQLKEQKRLAEVGRKCEHNHKKGKR